MPFPPDRSAPKARWDRWGRKVPMVPKGRPVRRDLKGRMARKVQPVLRVVRRAPKAHQVPPARKARPARWRRQI
jgi:hypothetical protein